MAGASLWGELGGAVEEALIRLLPLLLACVVWTVAKSFGERKVPAILAYGAVVALCAFFAIGAWLNYGQDDDENFRPAPRKARRQGLVVFIMTATIAVHGTWRGRHPPEPPESN